MAQLQSVSTTERNRGWEMELWRRGVAANGCGCSIKLFCAMRRSLKRSWMAEVRQ